MGLRRRSQRYEEDELHLQDVLEPYGDQSVYSEEPVFDEGDFVISQNDSYQNNSHYSAGEYQPYPEAGYADYLPEDEPEDGLTHENRFGVAAHVLDAVSSLAGILVILILVAMLLTLVDWLRTDILHSVVLLQSGIS